jgi:hypothetical protein
VPAAGHKFSAVSVGGDDTCRQEAEAACLAAAEGTVGDAGVTADTPTPDRPQKRQRKAAAADSSCLTQQQ